MTEQINSRDNTSTESINSRDNTSIESIESSIPTSSRRLSMMKIKAWIKTAGFLVVSAVAVGVVLSLHSYTAYARAIKSHFDLSETQVMVISSLILVSTSLTVIGGIVHDIWGALSTAILALIVSTTGWAGLWLTVMTLKPQPTSFYFFMLSIVLAGYGASTTEILIFSASLSFTAPKYRVIVILLLEIGSDVGIFVFSLIYEHIYINENDIDLASQSLDSFILLELIVVLIFNIIVVLMLPNARNFLCESLEDDENNTIDLDRSALNDTQHESGELIETSAKFYADIITPTYAFLSAAITVPIGITYFTILNITLETPSLSLNQYDYSLVVSQRFIVILGKILVTFILIGLRNFRCTNEIILFLNNILLLTSQVVLSFWMDHPVAFWVSYILICLCHAVFVTMTAVTVSSLFTSERLGTNLGLLITLGPIMATIYQVSFGVIYDSEAIQHECHGKHCFEKFYTLTICMSAFATVPALCLLCNQVRQRRSTTILSDQ